MKSENGLKVERTKYYSFRAGPLAEGCERCVEGEKLVLFVSGLCSKRCDFCPLSDKKLYKDVVYANERPLKDPSDVLAILEEAKACSATGAGITGGDPLIVLERTVDYIRLLKKTFGQGFHIHIYTPLNLVTEQKLKLLYDAGLDEIRLHPELGKPKEWEKISLAKKFDWLVGVEIPAFPDKVEDTKRLIDYISGKADFLNLNELELADNKVWRRVKNIKTKNKTSYAIKGSEEAALKLIKYSAKKGLRTHYCTCTLKDKVQLAKRIIRRAEKVKLPTDKVTEEGLLLRGVIYLSNFKPGFGYREAISSLEEKERQELLERLFRLRSRLLVHYKDIDGKIFIDFEKYRLITSESVVKKIRQEAGFSRAVVFEYPTFDALEIELEFLDKTE